VEIVDPLADAPGSLNLDAISVAGQMPGESRLDVFLQVGYENLSFVKQEAAYRASYEITLSILDSAGTLVSEKLWTEEVKVATFEETVSSNSYALLQRVFQVRPGLYRISAGVRDLETKRTRNVGRQLLVSDYGRDSVMLSDLLLISRLTLKGEARSIVPAVSPNLGLVADPVHFFLEAYNRGKVDSVDFVISAIDAKGDAVLTRDTVDVLRPGRNERILQFPHGTLPLGDYRLVVRLRKHEPGKEDPPSLATTNRTFVIRWAGLPRTIKDLDLAIDQARYIARDDEYSLMKDAKNPEEKQQRFLEFWKKRDPNPNTPRNEKMEEYYARVEYANRTFRHYIDGWRTDMGMVYVMFGPPNDVSRHPFDVDSKPYEIWRYYDLDYDFVFLDQTGFGDYRLTTPIWEVWKRSRN
jgi:GWxTD domain-containing protein